MGLALAGVRQGKSMLDLQLDHGFESGSGFRTAFNRLVGAPPSRASGVDCLYAHWLETPLGAMLALADDNGLALLEFVDRRGLERELETLQRRLERRILPGAHRYLAYFGDVKANVYAVDAENGKQLWTKTAESHPLARVTGAPVLHDGRLYVPIASFEAHRPRIHVRLRGMRIQNPRVLRSGKALKAAR